MGSDKMTKKLGQFIACGAMATMGFAYAAEPVKTAQPPVQAQVNATKLAAKKAKKVKPAKSTKPVAAPAAKVAPAK